jgi:hypothetical protein
LGGKRTEGQHLKVLPLSVQSWLWRTVLLAVRSPEEQGPDADGYSHPPMYVREWRANQPTAVVVNAAGVKNDVLKASRCCSQRWQCFQCASLPTWDGRELPKPSI